MLRLQDNYYKLQESPDIQALHRLLGIEWSKGFVKFKELKHYALYQSSIHNTYK